MLNGPTAGVTSVSKLVVLMTERELRKRRVGFVAMGRKKEDDVSSGRGKTKYQLATWFGIR